MRTSRFQLVELLIGANVSGDGAQVNFQDQPLLRAQADNKVYIQAIEVYSDQVLSTMPSGNVIVPVAQLINATLTLNINNFFQLKQLPLARANPMYADTGAAFAPYTPNILMFDNLTDVIWTQSFIQFSADPSGAVPFTILFGVHYDLKPHIYTS